MGFRLLTIENVTTCCGNKGRTKDLVVPEGIPVKELEEEVLRTVHDLDSLGFFLRSRPIGHRGTRIAVISLGQTPAEMVFHLQVTKKHDGSIVITRAISHKDIRAFIASLREGLGG